MRASHLPKGGLTPATSSMSGSTPALIQQRSNMAENEDEDNDDLLVRNWFDNSQSNMINPFNTCTSQEVESVEI